MNFAQTELLIHVVNRDTNRILDVDRWVCVCCLPPPWSWVCQSAPTLELGSRVTPSCLLYGRLLPRDGQGR